MKIAQVAPLIETVPPTGYGGTERVVAHLCNALVDRGHDVTLFAAAGSRTRAKLVSARAKSLRSDKPEARHHVAAHLNMLDHLGKIAADFDFLHFHTDLLHLPLFAGRAVRSITTLHTQLNRNDARSMYRRWAIHPFVGLSNSHKASMPEVNWVASIPNGLSPDLLPASFTTGDYLAFLGRFSPDKGAHIAIKAAIKLGQRLLLAARIDASNLPYFYKEIVPMLDHPLVDFIGEIGDNEKAAFLGGASALLFPISWPEPFGLVMIEALACGTPVVATRFGAVDEIIKDGINGTIVREGEEMAEAVVRAESISRRSVRDSFEWHFTSDLMAQRYIDTFEGLSSP